MPVPKRKTSHSKRNKRRAHDALTAPATIPCPECGSELEVKQVNPFVLAEAPKEEEDWGE